MKMIVQSIVMIAPIIYIIYIRKEKITSYGFLKFEWRNFFEATKHGLFILFTAFLITFLVVGILVQTKLIDLKGISEIKIKDLSQNLNIVLVVFSIVPLFFVSLGEELAFRSFFYRKLQNLFKNDIIIIIAINLIFALGHLYQGFIGFVVTFVLGIVFAINFRRYGNIYSIIFLHTAKNFLAIVVRV